MPDDEKSTLDKAFQDFRREAAAQVTPAGLAAARAVVRRRRLARITVLSTVVLLLLGGSTAYALSRDGRGEALPGVTSSATPTSTGIPSPIVTVEPTMSQAPAVEMNRCNPLVAASPPAGGMTEQQICDGTIETPTWEAVPGQPAVAQCPSGQVPFGNGRRNVGPALYLSVGTFSLGQDGGFTYVDVNNDGTAETIVLMSCGDSDHWVSQVFALTRDGAGRFVPLARVLSVGATAARLRDITAGPQGTVRVLVEDVRPGTAKGDTFAQSQWRGFSYAGGAFRQTDGPTSFEANSMVADLTVSTTNLAFSPLSGGTRTGHLTVTVQNLSPSSAPFSVELNLPHYVSLEPAGNVSPIIPLDPMRVKVLCSATVPGGSTVVFPLTFTTTLQSIPAATAEPGADSAVATVSTVELHVDQNVTNNTSGFRITFG